MLLGVHLGHRGTREGRTAPFTTDIAVSTAFICAAPGVGEAGVGARRAIGIAGALAGRANLARSAAGVGAVCFIGEAGLVPCSAFGLAAYASPVAAFLAGAATVVGAGALVTDAEPLPCEALGFALTAASQAAAAILIFTVGETVLVVIAPVVAVVLSTGPDDDAVHIVAIHFTVFVVVEAIVTDGLRIRGFTAREVTPALGARRAGVAADGGGQVDAGATVGAAHDDTEHESSHGSEEEAVPRPLQEASQP